MSSQNSRFSGQVALVVGAASGIGRATALRLATEAATVVCADRNEEAARATAEAAGPRALAIRLDVTVESDWVEGVDRTLGLGGRLDVLVNTAGVSSGSPLVETTLEDWRRIFAVNLDGAFLGTKHAILAMRERGGSIVHVASASGVRAASGAAAYSASKAGLGMLVKAAAKECRDRGLPIRVNAVCPGGVKTPMWSSMPFFQDLVHRTGSEEAAYRALATGPGERFAEPDEVVAAIAFLASHEAGFITGTDLVVDGGYVL
jgi:3(or 17)beta-hydroxysteroid dehydrogenase